MACFMYITGPNGVLRVYYLGCHYELQRKLDHTAEFLGHSVGSPGEYYTIYYLIGSPSPFHFGYAVM